MKKNVFTTLAAIVLLITSCHKDDVVSTPLPASGGDTFAIPTGSEVTRVDAHTINIKFPEDVRYVSRPVGATPGSEAFLVSEATVRCTCQDKDGGSCSPFEIEIKGQKQFGCVTNNINPCTDCKMSVTTSAKSGPIDRGGKLRPGTALQRGEFINYQDGIYITVAPRDEVVKMPSVFPDMFAVKEINDQLTNYVTGLYDKEDLATLKQSRFKSDGSLPKDFAYRVLVVAGRTVYIAVNYRKEGGITGKSPFLNLLPGDDGTGAKPPKCTCQKGDSGGCKLVEMKVPIYGHLGWYCDAGNCTDCKLSL